MNLINNKLKYKVGDRIITHKKDFTILEISSYIKCCQTYYSYKYLCNLCGYIGIMGEVNISRRTCQSPDCFTNKINGIPKNSIVLNEKSKWMIKYFQNGYDEAKLYTYNSHQRIYFKCPDCNKILTKSKMVRDLYFEHSIGCTCSDGISYPNKFIHSLLNQLQAEYEYEQIFNWAKNKRYDIYISKYNMIIENHGLQHYKSTRRKNSRTLEEEQTNDKYKKEMAINNGINYYIEIDCRKSELKWIRDSVMNSNLPNLLHFKEEDIDWLECEEYAIKNIVKEVCDFKNKNPNMLISEIIQTFKLSEYSISKYLTIGNNLGWCIYNPQLSRKISAERMVINRSNKVLCIEKDIVFLHVKELENLSMKIFGFKLERRGVSRSCKNNNTYKGYYFKYISTEEYQNKLSEQ